MLKKAGDPAQVKSLITSIKSYKGFKNMAAYNISCLMSHITPPTVGWRENILTAVESGGIESIIDLLREHPHAMDMLKLATDALSGLSTSSTNAGLIARAGGVEAALNAMLGLTKAEAATEDGQDAQESGAKLLVKVAQFNPSAILDSTGGVSAVLDGLTHSDNGIVKAACATVADRVGVSERGQKELLKKGAIEALVTAIAPGTDNSEDMLKPTFRLLERFAEDPANVKKMRDLGGVEALVYQLEAHADNEVLLRMGGRLLAKVADGDLEDAIQRLKAGGLSEKYLEFTTALLANLALQPENIDRIVQQGGVRVLIQNFDQFNPKTQVAAARALGRVANNKDNAAEIIREGGVKVLVEAMRTNADNEELVTACSQAISNIATSSLEHAQIVDQQGGIQAVLDSMRKHPEFAANAVNAMNMVEQLANMGFDTHRLVHLGAVESILEAMAANINDPEVQRAGFKSLTSLMENEKPVKGAPKTAAIAVISYKGGVQTMVGSLEVHRDKPSVVSPALATFSTIILKESSAAAKLSHGNVVPAVVSAVYSLTLSAALGSIQATSAMDGKFEKNLGVILSALVDKKDAVARVKALPNDTASMCAGKDSESLEGTLMAIAVYAKESTLVKHMHGAGVVSALLQSYQAVVEKNGLPMQESVMAAFALAIASLARAGPDFLEMLSTAGASKLCLLAIQKHTKASESTICAMRAIRVFASSLATRAKLVDERAIDICASAMRANNENPHVALAALDVFLSLAASDSICPDVAYKGGTRQAIAMISDTASSEVFERPAERALMVLERVASSKVEETEIRNNLLRQGAVGAVTQAMESYPWNENIESIGARLLSKLMDASQVEAEIENMRQLVEELKTTKQHEKVLPKLARSMATVGALALSPSNTEIMESKGAAGIIVDALHTMSKLPLTREREYARRAGFRALGQIASMAPLPSNLGAVQLIIKALRAKETDVTNLEKIGALNCVKYMANIRTSTDELVDAGVVAVIVGLLKENTHDEQFVTAGLGALGALAIHESGAKSSTDAGVVRLALNFMRNFGDTCGPRFSEEAMELLANLALISKNVKEMMDGNVVDLVMAALEHHCSDPSAPEPRVLTAAVTLLQRLANTEANIRLLVKKGAVTKVIDIANSSIVYLNDPECAEALLFLIETCALVKDTHEALNKAGAAQLVMNAMSLNPANESVVMTGSKALQTLLGNGSENIKGLLSEVSKLAAQLKKHPTDKQLQAQLTQALRNLANLSLVDGVVTAKSAPDVAKTAVETMDIVQSTVPDGPSKSELLSAAMQILARAAMVKGAKVDSEKAIKKLLEIIRANPGDEMVLESAMYALGNLLSTPDDLKTLATNGGLQLIEKTLNEAGENDGVREAASKALERARVLALNSASTLAKEKAGSNALAEILKTFSGDQHLLREMLQEIAAGKNGISDLLAILGSDAFRTASPETRAAVLRALREKLEREPGSLKVTSAADMLGLLAALSESTDGLNKTEKEQLLRRQKEAVEVLGLLNGSSAAAFAAADGVQKLLDMLQKNSDDPEVVKSVLRALANMADDKAVVSKLVDGNAAKIIADLMRQYPDDEEIQQEAVKILGKMAAVKGVAKVGMDADTMRLINRTVDQFKDNRDIQRYGEKLLGDLSLIYREEGSDMIPARLDASLLKMAAADHIQVLHDENGRPYYYNTQTRETTWEMPDELKDSLAALSALAKLTGAHKDNIQAVDPNALTEAVNYLSKHANEGAHLTSLVENLGHLARNKENASVIVEAGGLEAIIKALNGDHVDPAFLTAAIDLLNQFSKNDAFKDQIGALGGIQALIMIMLKFIAHLELVEKCMSTLANLAYNSKRNVAEVMKCDGPDAVQKCMSRYHREAELLHSSLILLSNIMYGSDQNKLVVGRKCGNEIIGVARQHFQDKKLLKSALRAIGNLSYCDENILWIVSNGATKCIVAGMNAHEGDIETQQISIEVIGNFASLNEDDDDTRRRIERGEQQSVFDIIMLEGGAKRILDSVRKSDEPSLIMCGMEALGNLAHNSVITEKLIKMGIVELVFTILDKFYWDEELLEKAVRLIAILTYSEEGVAEIKRVNGVLSILSAMETRKDQVEFLVFAVTALKNVAADADLRHQIGEQNGIRVCFDLMEENLAAEQLLLEILTLLIRLTRTEELSEKIASTGMNVILEAINHYKDNADFLIPAYTLIGHLAFTESNLKIITQYGGIDVIIDSILAHPESKSLVIRCIQTLDNVAMHSAEQSKIVQAAGGEATIKEVIAAYKGDKEVVQVGKSALLSMQPQVERRRAKPKYAFKNDQGEDSRMSGSDPLREYRNFLKTGAVLVEWSNGGPHSRHLYLKPDFRHLAWRDPKKSAKTEATLNIRDVRNVRSGIHEGHKKGRRQAKPDLAFTIVGRAMSLDLEARTPQDRERWVEALNALLHTYKNDPKWLNK